MTLSATLRAVLPPVTAQWAIPPRLVLVRPMLYRTAGNPIAPAGIAEPIARSPLHSTGKITDALMVPQGASDRRVPQGESKQMIKMLLVGAQATILRSCTWAVRRWRPRQPVKAATPTSGGHGRGTCRRVLDNGAIARQWLQLAVVTIHARTCWEHWPVAARACRRPRAVF